jgi:hypothetical protein
MSIHVHQGKTLHHQSFILEECVFIECHLKECDLFFSGGDTEWVNTKFENCRFHWRGPAKSTFALLQVMGILPQQPPAPTPPISTAAKPN